MRETSRHVTTFLLFGLGLAGVALFAAAHTPLRPRAISIEFPAAAAGRAPIVELQSCATIEEAVFFKVMGVVRSATREPVKYAIARAEFLDADGRVLDQSRTLPFPEVLLPDVRSRFVLVTKPDPRICRVRVSFVDDRGEPLPADTSCREPEQGFVEP